MRRLLDVLFACAGLCALAPVLAIAALAIKLDTPGPALYWQERVGRYGRVFRLVKLRTMVQDAEADGQPLWAQNGDARVTRVGSVLRRSRLDEIPQLWNVLRGEMSLIGPRPERPAFVAILASHSEVYPSRHVIRPGMTGWGAGSVRLRLVSRGRAHKLQYDLYYIRYRSIPLDARIVLLTLVVVFRFKGL